MLLIKLGIKLYYTDTDSFFVDKELPEYLIGKELGQLKDELNGGVIKKAYFLGIKNMVISMKIMKFILSSQELKEIHYLEMKWKKLLTDLLLLKILLSDFLKISFL